MQYTVIGFYPETRQRYAAPFYTESADEAEEKATEMGVSVCGVIEGSHPTKESNTYVN